MKFWLATPLVCLISSSLLCTAQVSAARATKPTSVAGTLPAPRFLYSSDFKSNKVRGYVINASTGSIQSNGQSPVSTQESPTRVASDKGGFRLYVISVSSNKLDAYFINRTNGHLTAVPGSPFTIRNQPQSVIVHPSGKFVYVTAQPNEVFAFAVQANGSLKAVPGSPFSTQTSPEALTIDPQGKYLYVSDYPTTNKIDAFSISATDGALTPVPGSPYTQPSSSSCANGAWDLAVHPSGNFLVLPNMCEGLVVYRINRSTGTLSLVSGSPFPVPYPPNPDVESIAMDPQGKYFWVTTEFCQSGCAQTTDTWKFNATTGVPTYLESGQGACGLLVRPDPSGTFLYEAGNTNGNPNCPISGLVPGIWGFSLNRTTGAIKNVPGSPFPSPNADWFLYVGLAVTP